MRVAFLSSFYPLRGGIAQFNAALYRQFELQHTVKAFTFSKQYPDILFPGTTQYVTEDDKADKIDAIEVLNTVNPISYFTTAKKIKHYAPDILVMKYWMPFFAPSLGTVAKLVKSKTKVITILDNVIPHEKRIGDIALNNYFLNQNHGFVVMSDVVKNDLLSLKPNAKYIYHQHPLYNHFGNKLDKAGARAQLNLPADKKILLFFGFIRGYKGLDLLIKAMKNLSEEYHLVIAGEIYGSFDEYDALISELGVSTKITQLVRYINDAEVSVLFSAADVNVLPYKSATQSGITSIAYHFDLPIIATDVGGLKESIYHNKTGLIVPEPNPDQITSSINDYFSANKSVEFEKNIQELKKQMSWESLANSIVKFSDSL
ncbi:MAG: glycosyltransferase [Bacteroidetes bacterium]|nr:glycosyltransferase [Bacteroidota bacterium]